MNDVNCATKRQWICRHRVPLLSALAVIAYIAFIEWLFGWETVLAQWRALGFLPVVAASALMLASYLLRTWRIHDYFQKETTGNFARLFRVTQVHNVLNIMLPFRTGEISFPVLMKTEFGISIIRATSALFVMRLLDLHALLAAGTFGIVFETNRPPVGRLVWILFLLLPAFAYAFRRPVFRLFADWAPQRFQPIGAELEAGLPTNALLFIRAWIMTLINWFAKMAMLVILLGYLGLESVAAAFGGALGGELSSVLPIHAPAGVGTYPAAITAGALAFGGGGVPEARENLSRASINLHLLIVVAALAGVIVSLAVDRAYSLLERANSE
ncbi:flippase-like domain-containing protein [Rhizobium pusense]|uniref:lysylphosphatidylglycerol synthase transmembrane domain-containing protein n=1 Tax=Agrobacterium pusense TaxID=648995 RepID=UPI000D1C208B|nr:lysylphosphatidylglycerol synthase transmembrane domain-containing protein [Agrobacterium pusense]MDH0910475.1 flippase-like domain-containing protein [Agrobacterium pusense]MDH1098410.1 flippase-like domain-containing protein [Agrobacterium pusense]MDH1114520.1 flippase-like domain-containing protein [Agrobacterium pusense]MDH2195716.1 flippase-like domain-containing protein [Agrobacterium pusense]